MVNIVSPVSKRLLVLQIQLTQLPSLPPTLENTSNAQKEITLASETAAPATASMQLTSISFCISPDLLAAGDTLELAVFLSVKMQDEAAFERNYQQLQMYTSDTRY